MTGQSQAVLKLFGCRRNSQVAGEPWEGGSSVDSWELPSFLLPHRKGQAVERAWLERCCILQIPWGHSSKNRFNLLLGSHLLSGTQGMKSSLKACPFSVGIDWVA